MICITMNICTSHNVEVRLPFYKCKPEEGKPERRKRVNAFVRHTMWRVRFPLYKCKLKEGGNEGEEVKM